jgi:hypothetical protein
LGRPIGVVVKSGSSSRAAARTHRGHAQGHTSAERGEDAVDRPPDQSGRRLTADRAWQTIAAREAVRVELIR